MSEKGYFAHESAIIDPGAEIGEGTKIWHFSHVASGARIGRGCSLGQNVYVASTVCIGDSVRIQNNVSVYDGVELEDAVFCGPSCVFTNVAHPRSEFSRAGHYDRTVVRRGATIGANATIVCGTTVGRYAFVGAGAVVARRDVPDYALMLGVPARQHGWVGRHGIALVDSDSVGVMRCPVSGWRYQKEPSGGLRCLDWGEEVPAPPAMFSGPTS